MSVIENDEWCLSAYVHWRLKRENSSETCPTCNGRGEQGGGFKDVDGPRTCKQCFGTGIVHKGPNNPAPPIPEGLVEHMRKAWEEFFK